MTPPFDPGRRRILKAAAAFAAVVVLGPRTLSTALGLAGADPDQGTLLRQLVPHRSSAARLGRLYLATAPQEADPSRLAALILEGSPSVSPRSLASRFSADFAAGRTVRLDGWVMSRSEARLCALAALT